jgi:hydroxyacylglutathione hydrolase
VLTIHHFNRGPLDNNVHLLVDETAGRAAIVDPGIDSEDILAHATERNWKIELILNTHAHFDHVYLNAWYAERTQAPIALHRGDVLMLRALQETCLRWGMPVPEASPEPAVLLEHGQTLDIFGTPVEVRHTPGHSPGQVAFIFGNDAIVGDTLFHRGVGRWDLPGASWEQLERSIREQLYTLPDEMNVWPGHGTQTTIGQEKRFNPYVGAGARLIPKV